jgi:hypothetical protein
LEHFRVSAEAFKLTHIRLRATDYYLSLVGELFHKMRTADGTGAEWARLGNALGSLERRIAKNCSHHLAFLR